MTTLAKPGLAEWPASKRTDSYPPEPVLHEDHGEQPGIDPTSDMEKIGRSPVSRSGFVIQIIEWFNGVPGAPTQSNLR